MKDHNRPVAKCVNCGNVVCEQLMYEHRDGYKTCCRHCEAEYEAKMKRLAIQDGYEQDTKGNFCR